MYPVELINISKSFRTSDSGSEKLTILENLNLQLEEGKTTAVIGKSGSGKSTLLQIAGLLDKPTTGSVLINGKDVVAISDVKKANLRNTYIGFIFQANLLLSDFTALENVMMPALINKADSHVAAKKAQELLEYLGLGNRVNHLPSQLSGGEKQRVAICRALINNPSVIMADEPTGSLDETNASEVENLLLNICEDRKKSLLLVTHNLDFANRCQFVYVLSNGGLTLK